VKTHRILYQHLGEYSYTPKTPRRVYREGTVDLDAKTRHTILSSDDFRPCPVQKYEVREVELPDWLSPEEWLASTNYLRWHVAMGQDLPVEEWPEHWVRWAVYDLGTEKRRVIIQLLTANLRSSFKKSLRSQVVEWLETPPEDRKYREPLSVRQWNCLLRPRYRH
jgi:hypothetical protein